MNFIKTSVLFFDLIERLDHALNNRQISPDMETKVKSRPRIFFAMSEAVKFFVTRGPVPLNALSGFIPQKLYKLQASPYQSAYNNLKVYDWPEVANKSRLDGGLLRLSLNGKVFEPEISEDPRVLNIRITSLQNQAENTLMYGPDHQNAVADLNGTQVFVPENIVPRAQIVLNPDPVTVERLSRGRDVLVITGGATSHGDVTITNTTQTQNIQVPVASDDDPETVAEKIVKKVNETPAMKLNAVLYGDEVRFYTSEQGPEAYTEVTVDTTASVTFNKTSLTLEPKETEEIPIDQTHQDTVAVAAFNHLIFNVAHLGQPAEPAEAQPADHAAEQPAG